MGDGGGGGARRYDRSSASNTTSSKAPPAVAEAVAKEGRPLTDEVLRKAVAAGMIDMVLCVILGGCVSYMGALIGLVEIPSNLQVARS